MIYPIVNGNENIVIGAGIRPLIYQEKIDLVNYLQFSRLFFAKHKFSRYQKYMISGANTCITYKVIKAIGKFDQNRLIAEDISRGKDILSKGFKIYHLTDFRSRIYTYYPDTIKEYIKQRKKYFENMLVVSFKLKNRLYFLKFSALIIVSIYFLVFPIFLLLHIGLFFIGILILVFLYLKKLRLFIFFRILVEKKYYKYFHIILFFKMFYYIYIELITNIVALFNLRSLKKKIKIENSG